MSILQNSNAISVTDSYSINNSLRFRSSASAYLTRTLGTPTSGSTWTWSCWTKRGEISTANYHYIFSYSGSGDPGLQFGASTAATYPDGAYLYNGTTTQYTTGNARYRDPAAWYHIVVSSNAGTVTMYINGVSVLTGATMPAMASGSTLQIGRYIGGSYYYDGYIAEVYFVDGQALAATSFGQTSSTTGVWQPKAYTGTYGTNGFYLKFSDIATTSGSNAGLGKDFSGNGNYYNTNNISVTSGVTYDAMIDSPTNAASATQPVGNYCVMNPLGNAIGSSPSGYLSNANLTVSGNANAGYLGTISIPAGKYYFEGTLTTLARQSFGLCSDTVSMSQDFGTNLNYYGFYFNPAGNYIDGSTNPWAASAPSAGSIVQVAVDATNPASINFWIGINNVWYNSTGGTTGNPSTGANATQVITANVPLFPLSTLRSGASSTTNLNFGQRPFSYTPPTDFKSLCTANISDSTILQGNKYMDATTYTGNGSTQSITNAGGFKPDLVWVKSRSAATDHKLTDSVRGVQKGLISDTTGAETTDTNGLTAFNSNGWSLGTDTVYNNNAATYVAWQWQAGQGTTSSGTGTGGITSVTQSVNTTAGFSIVTYTGSGANGTVTHGLGVAPKMVIIKRRNSTSYWSVYHAGLTSANYVIYLNTTDAQNNDSTYFNGTAPTSTVFSLGSNATPNASGGTYVSYCFAEIAGFSKFGSYTGNGSNDGPFIYTGFRPKYIMRKCSTNPGYGCRWEVIDTTRSTYNQANIMLSPNYNSAEDSTAAYWGTDILSNGFKLRNTDTEDNVSGQTYIYAAFAENPFKNALAR